MSRAGVSDDAAILQMTQYDDGLTMAALQIACEVASVALDDALELFGRYF